MRQGLQLSFPEGLDPFWLRTGVQWRFVTVEAWCCCRWGRIICRVLFCQTSFDVVAFSAASVVVVAVVRSLLSTTVAQIVVAVSNRVRMFWPVTPWFHLCLFHPFIHFTAVAAVTFRPQDALVHSLLPRSCLLHYWGAPFCSWFTRNKVSFLNLYIWTRERWKGIATVFINPFAGLPLSFLCLGLLLNERRIKGQTWGWAKCKPVLFE